MFIYSGGTLLLRQYCQIGESPCDKKEYDIFSIQADARIQEVLSQSDGDLLTRYPLLNSVNRELCHIFTSYAETRGKKLFLASQLISKGEFAIRLHLWCPSHFKLWLDNRCIAISSGKGNLNPLVFLSKGIHTFFIEQYAPDSTDCFAIQLREEKRGDCEGWVRSHSEPLFVGDSPFFPLSPSYRFMYIISNYRCSIYRTIS